jgi:hypothetical protein
MAATGTQRMARAIAARVLSYVSYATEEIAQGKGSHGRPVRGEE